MSLETTAFKIMTSADWQRTVAEGTFDGSEVDRADGYIHLSTEAQLAETVTRHYAGQADLTLARVDLTACGEAVVWEASRGGALFPHLYGPLPRQAVTSVRALRVDAQGKMTLGEDPAA